MKVLTFVVPAYNSENYLEKCISSMLLKEVLSEIEIIVVNDGSTDKTAVIAERYCAQYPETIRLISQENRGHGGALNTGCAAARGKYLKVVDADDWIRSENLQDFIMLLKLCNSDVVLTHHHTIDISNGEVRNWKSYPPEFGKAYTFDEIMVDWNSYNRSLTLHGITYRRDFYREFGKPLSEHVFYEDYEYATFPCCLAKTITPFDLFLYEYRIGDVNQSVSSANQLKRIGHTEIVLRNMTEKYHHLSEFAGARYAAMKIQELLLSYFTTVLLVEPDKRKGRVQASRIMNDFRTRCPEVHSLARRKYQILLLMNRLHISKQAWSRFLASRIYIMLTPKRSFN